MTRLRAVSVLAVLVLNLPAAADLAWDTNTGTPDAQGGTGTWNTSSALWWNGAANQTWTNNPADRALFGEAPGTVTLTDGLVADSMVFQTSVYTLKADSDLTFTGDITAPVAPPPEETYALSKAGTGFVTVDGDVALEYELRLDNGKGGFLIDGGQWTGAGAVRFTGAVPHYDNSNLARGIHLDGGGTTTMASRVYCRTFTYDIVLGARNNSTLVYDGFMKADQTNDVNILVTNGGKFVLGPNAGIDLMNEVYFTRQFWVHGDGTGVIEAHEDFVADRTAFGTVEEGFGSIRISNATFITNHSQNIPMGYRPNAPGGGPGVNAHFVFENDPGGRWIVQTNDQTSLTATWIQTNATIETRTNLTHEGRTVVWPDYTAYNGFQIRTAGVHLTKEGSATLTLAGDQGYNTNTCFDVVEGAVQFNTDPITGPGNGFTNGQNLTVNVSDTGAVCFNANPCRIKALNVSAGGTALVATGMKLDVNDTVAVTGGTLGGGGRVDESVANTGGTVAPGDSIGTFTIEDNYTQGPAATLAIQIGAAGNDCLVVQDHAELDGLLEVFWLDAFVPAPGASFQVLTWGTRAGTFADLTGRHAGLGRFVDPVYGAADLTLLAWQADAGDTDGDHDVDATDLASLGLAWDPSAKNPGNDWTNGDFDDDGDVDATDLAAIGLGWNPSGGAAPIPEPVTLALVALGAAAMITRR